MLKCIRSSCTFKYLTVSFVNYASIKLKKTKKFKLVDGVKQISLPSVGGPHRNHRRPEQSKGRGKRELVLSLSEHIPGGRDASRRGSGGG